MIGVFDSGAGGLTAIKELRKIAPNVNICFLADRKNAPYGTKSLDEIIEFAHANIKKLLSLGAEKILIACCTASAAYPYLSESEKQVCVPIIMPAAKRAVEISKTKRIGVIATERTVKEKAFRKAIIKLSPKAKIFELETQLFVSLVENGARDSKLTENEKLEITRTLSPLRDKGIDTLILGCTHFPHIEKEIRQVLGVKTVNPSLEGALKISKTAELSEDGRTVYL
ncbi:MAG: glutamate racemase [Clostridia bacterium]|nr:glutamate racemase [Clostridia bacterium]